MQRLIKTTDRRPQLFKILKLFLEVVTANFVNDDFKMVKTVTLFTSKNKNYITKKDIYYFVQ